MDKTKLIVFLLGAFWLLLAILVEFSSVALVGSVGSAAGVSDQPPPGIGFFGIALVDPVLAHALALLTIDLLAIARSFAARLQGIVTLVLSLLGLLGTLVFAFATFTMIMLMITLLLAAPFGTLAYFAVWGHFPTGPARISVALVMSLKLIGIGLIAASHLTLLKNKLFLVLAGCSIGLTFVLG